MSIQSINNPPIDSPNLQPSPIDARVPLVVMIIDIALNIIGSIPFPPLCIIAGALELVLVGFWMPYNFHFFNAKNALKLKINQLDSESQQIIEQVNEMKIGIEQLVEKRREIDVTWKGHKKERELILQIISKPEDIDNYKNEIINQDALKDADSLIEYAEELRIKTNVLCEEDSDLVNKINTAYAEFNDLIRYQDTLFDERADTARVHNLYSNLHSMDGRYLLLRLISAICRIFAGCFMIPYFSFATLPGSYESVIAIMLGGMTALLQYFRYREHSLKPEPNPAT